MLVILKVERSGGFAGLMAGGELDTSAEPDRERLEKVVRGPGPGTAGLWSSTARPVRLPPAGERHGGREPTQLTVAEQDLDETPPGSWTESCSPRARRCESVASAS